MGIKKMRLKIINKKEKDPVLPYGYCLFSEEPQQSREEDDWATNGPRPWLADDGMPCGQIKRRPALFSLSFYFEAKIKR